ncbi:MAG TPA: adenosylcobinamide-GDP ribazoletransferase [Methanosarcinaceae archaeon]|nr:adenosylcobinamide-GDP ribazoletransferase [Methanosarcinaceae archaeon]
MSSFLLAVRSGFGFLSTIPVGITMEGLDELMKRSYLFTFVGAVLGLIIGGFAFLFETIFPPQISAVFIIVSIYYLTGLNHLDGLSDFGDGATAHGSLEKKIGALKDMSLGIGGVAYATISLIALYASITALQNEAALFSKGVNTAAIVLISMFIAEVSAKQAMLTIAAFGKPIHEGLGSIAINNTNLTKFTIGLLFGAAACMLAFGIFGILALLTAIISALVVLNISNRHFGGINGDCIGTANEIGRIVALMTIVVLMHIVVTKYDTWSIAWMQL